MTGKRYSSTQPIAPPRDAERRAVIERAKREVPLLRQKSRSNLAALRKITSP
jgi:hypothetical protein